MSLTKCPNCGKSVTGFLSASIVSQQETDYINENLDLGKEAYCSSCSDDLLLKVFRSFQEQRSGIQKRVLEIIHHVPILTGPAPNAWEYEVLDIVTAQTTAGTGFITELSQSFNDLLGMGSRTTDRKIAVATERCKSDLRSECVKLGGNAILSVDIDFNEVGAGNTNMLMVCMAGTAVRLISKAAIEENRWFQLAEVSKLGAGIGDIDKKIKYKPKNGIS